MISTNLRIEEELWRKLKTIALEEKRSINQEINYIISIYIQEKEKMAK